MAFLAVGKQKMQFNLSERNLEYLIPNQEWTQCQNPVMNVKLKITRFCNWLQSLRLYFCSTSPTGSENHLSPLRFQTFNRKVFEIGMKLRNREKINYNIIIIYISVSY